MKSQILGLSMAYYGPMQPPEASFGAVTAATLAAAVMVFCISLLPFGIALLGARSLHLSRLWPKVAVMCSLFILCTATEFALIGYVGGALFLAFLGQIISLWAKWWGVIPFSA